MIKISYLPPLLVYAAYGVSGLTGIVGTFFVKDYLDLSAEFLAALAFWAGIPWAVKMPVGHVVDLIWRWKALLVWLGAAMIAASLLVMIGLISHFDAMRAMMSGERWFVLAALLAPTGYMIQDAVADAMTVEAVPRVDGNGRPYDEAARKSMHTTMQTLGRVAIIGGLALVALANVFLFHGTDALPKERKAEMYALVYSIALVIPVLSVAGVVLHGLIKMRAARRLQRAGKSAEEISRLTAVHGEDKTHPNWWILGGSLVFVAVTLSVGLSELNLGQELIFAASLAIILFLLWRLARELAPGPRETLVATALIIFVYRAMPSTGPGTTWWMIDVLKFDESFLAKLALVAYALTLVGMFALRGYIARNSIAAIIVMLTVASTLIALPNIGMYYGLHEWTLGQIAMIPMLAWIANSAPANLKATYFAVMASFSNLALSASQLGTKYLNQIYVVAREVRDRSSGAIKVPQDYSELGALMIAAVLVGFAVPLAAVAAVRVLRLRTA
jgi:hypothetical protein